MGSKDDKDCKRNPLGYTWFFLGNGSTLSSRRHWPDWWNELYFDQFLAYKHGICVECPLFPTGWLYIPPTGRFEWSFDACRLCVHHNERCWHFLRGNHQKQRLDVIDLLLLLGSHLVLGWFANIPSHPVSFVGRWQLPSRFMSRSFAR